MTLPATTIPPLPPLGGDVVTFVDMDRSSGTPDAMGEILPTPVRVDVTGCRHRAIPATTPTQREQPEDITDVGTQVWQTHAPPVPAALNAKVDGVMIVNGVTYRMEGGVVPVTGADGSVEFVKILSKVQLDNPAAAQGEL
jgi:hypothetical protein